MFKLFQWRFCLWPFLEHKYDNFTSDKTPAGLKLDVWEKLRGGDMYRVWQEAKESKGLKKAECEDWWRKPGVT